MNNVDAYVFPVSFGQQRLWFLDQLLPGNPLYNIPSAVRLTMPVSVPALQRSLNELVQRHEVLRTTFAVVEGQPVQVVAPAQELEVAVVDLRGVAEATREAEARRLAEIESGRPFALGTGPLLRATLLQLGDQDWILVLVLHHIVTDGWSMGVLFRELTALYSAFVVGRPSPLPALPIQYGDYAVWQRQWLSGEVRQQQVGYWRQQLAGLPVLALPTDRPRPAVQQFRGAQHAVRLPGELVTGLKALSQRHGVTLFMTLLAGFQTLLHRYTGQDDVVVGSPVAGRTRTELEGLIGFFVNTLVLRTDASGDPPFVTLLQRVQQTALAAYAHQDLPFEMLVEELHPERDLSRNPLFQTTFQLLHTPTAGAASNAGGIALDIKRDTAIFDLVLNLRDAGTEVTGQIEYNTDLFEAATIERMAAHFVRLLEGIVANPAARLSGLPLLDERERRQVLVEWNDTAAEYPRDKGIHELIQEQVWRDPHAVAVVCDDQHISYRELNARVNRVAHHLRPLGVGPEVPVGVFLERSIDMVVALLAVLKAGGAYLPLDVSYPEQRLAFMVQDAATPVIVTHSRLAPRLSGCVASLVQLDLESAQIGRASADDPEPLSTSENLAYVIYTSGSTGTPKGILIVHQGLTNYLTWCTRAYPLAAGRGAPVHSSVAFDLTVTGLFAPLLTGRAVHLIPEHAPVDALARALKNVRDFSLVKITPAHLELLRAGIAPGEADGLTRAFIIGGEMLTAETVNFWREHAPGTMLVNEYGPTESVVGCCVYCVTPDTARTGPVPIGRPIANTRLYVLDRRLQPVPVGVCGELYIGGDGLARGYLNRPDLTRERFLPDPFSATPDARMYKSGDLARFRPDGVIEYLGRVDRQVKIRGFRIEPAEIEAVLRQHAGVDDARVIVREDAPDDRRLVAYVTPPDVDLAGLRSFMAGRLPDHMVPCAIVGIDAFPLTANGKVDERALPPPKRTQGPGRAESVPPRTPVEEVLAAIWADVLRTEQPGIDDNFFTDLGGHSLIATQLVSRIRQTLNIDLPLRALFEAPTVAGIAQKIQEDGVTAARAHKAAELLLMMNRLSESEAETMLSAIAMPGEPQR